MDISTQEAINNITTIFDRVTSTDDKIIKALDKLKIILLNLKIEDARIKQNTGIDPIVIELNKSIQLIEKSVKDLVAENRELLRDSLEQIKKIGEE